MLSRIQGRIVHKALDRVSPLAVPVMLEIGRESGLRRGRRRPAGGGGGRAGEGGDGVNVRSAAAARTRSREPASDHARGRSARGRSGRRALLAGASGLLVVADLHLEKGSGFAARGVLLPPYDTAARWRGSAQRDRALSRRAP